IHQPERFRVPPCAVGREARGETHGGASDAGSGEEAQSVGHGTNRSGDRAGRNGEALASSGRTPGPGRGSRTRRTKEHVRAGPARNDRNDRLQVLVTRRVPASLPPSCGEIPSRFTQSAVVSDSGLTS